MPHHRIIASDKYDSTHQLVKYLGNMYAQVGKGCYVLFFCLCNQFISHVNI